MEFKTYKKRFNLKHFCIGVACSALILVPITVSTTRAKYQTSQSVPLIRGTINFKPYDFKIMAMYQENDSGEYEEVEVMPSSGYVINEEDSYCYTVTQEERDDTAVLYTDDQGQHVVGNLKKSSKCYLWFDVKPYTCSGSACEIIMANKTVSKRTSFNTVVTESSTNTVYKAEDDDGESYYFAGAATDNYVYFADKYWRIIRVNGDGTIRLIYDGTSARANGTSSTETQIGTSYYNSNHNDNAYVGFMYTLGTLRGLGTSSTVKGALDTWYTDNLASYVQYIDTNAGFCGDRTPYTNVSGTTSGGGTSTTETYYAGYIRLYYQLVYQSSTTASPTFKCANSSDLYTVSEANKGNKALSNPIGLISAEEVSYAGGLYGTNNTSYYLYTGQHYWTMSPFYFSSDARVLGLCELGYLNGWSLVNALGVRPVINLKSNVTLTGEGTTTSPYKIS